MPTIIKSSYLLISIVVFLSHSVEATENLSDQNPKVQNVPQKIAALAEYGEWGGYWLGADSNSTSEPIRPPFVPNPNSAQHYQGIARSLGNGVPYMYVTRSGDTVFSDDNLGTLDIIELASRPISGGRLGSNRLKPGVETKDTTPSNQDRVIKTIFYDDYWHPGGMTVIGDILAVALEGACLSEDDDGNALDYCRPGVTELPASVVRFYDISDPANPRFLYDFERPTGANVNVSDHQLGWVGVVKWKDQHYIVIPADGDTYWQFYRTTNDDGLANANDINDWEFVAEMSTEDFPSGGTDAFQSMHFVVGEGTSASEEDDSLFLVASQNQSVGVVDGTIGGSAPFVNGVDYIHLLGVEFDSDGVNITKLGQKRHVLRSAGNFVAFFDFTFAGVAATGGATLGGSIVGNLVLPGVGTYIGGFIGGLFGSGETNFTGFVPGEPDNFAKQEANFAASGSLHITPKGDLLYYSSSYYNRGPSGITRFAEIAPISRQFLPICRAQPGDVQIGIDRVKVSEGDLVNAMADSLTPLPWVSLYEDHGFSGRNVILDWQDRFLEDWNDFEKLDGNQSGDKGFNDKVSSFRYCLLPNWSLELFDDDNYQKRIFGDLGNNAQVESFQLTDNRNDKTTSVRILPPSSCHPINQKVRYEWNVNSDTNTIADVQFNPLTSTQSNLNIIDGKRNPNSTDDPSIVQLTASYFGPCAINSATSSVLELEVVNSPPIVNRPVITTLSGDVLGIDVLGAPRGLVALSVKYDDPAGLNDAGFEVTIDWGDSSSNTFTNEFPDAMPATLEGITHNYAQSGLFDVIVSVTDKDGGISSSQIKVNIDDKFATLNTDFDNIEIDDFSEDSRADYADFFYRNGQFEARNGDVLFDISQGFVKYNSNAGIEGYGFLTRAAKLKQGDNVSIAIPSFNVAATLDPGQFITQQLFVVDNPDIELANGYIYSLLWQDIGGFRYNLISVLQFINNGKIDDNQRIVADGVIVLDTGETSNLILTAGRSAGFIDFTFAGLARFNDIFNPAKALTRRFTSRLADFQLPNGQYDAPIDDIEAFFESKSLYVGVLSRTSNNAFEAAWDDLFIEDKRPLLSTPIVELAETQLPQGWYTERPSNCDVFDGSPSGNYALMYTDPDTCSITTGNIAVENIQFARTLQIPILDEGSPSPLLTWWQYVDKDSDWSFRLNIEDSNSEYDFQQYSVPEQYQTGWHKVEMPLRLADGRELSELTGLNGEIGITASYIVDIPNADTSRLGWIIDDVEVGFGVKVNQVCPDNVLADGSFELGNNNAFWVTELDSSGDSLFSTGDANNGSFSFALGTFAENNSGEVSISQSFTLPELTDARLKFAYKIQGGCVNCNEEDNFIEIWIDETLIWKLIPNELTSTYVPVSVLTSEFADGDLHRIKIKVSANDVDNILLDDFCLGALEACEIVAVELGENLDETQYVNESGIKSTTIFSRIALEPPVGAESCQIPTTEVVYFADDVEVGRSRGVKSGFAISPSLPSIPLNTETGDTQEVVIRAEARVVDSGQGKSDEKVTLFVTQTQEPIFSVNFSPSNEIGPIEAGNSETIEITITNAQTVVNSDDLELGVLNTVSQPWNIVSDNCSNAQLAIQEMCSISIAFNPSEAGNFLQLLEIDTNDPNAPIANIGVNGIATQTEIELVEVPLLIDLPLEEAKQLIENVGLMVGEISEMNSEDTPLDGVLQQDPLEGALVEIGSAINLVVSLGPTQRLRGDWDKDGDVDFRDVVLMTIALRKNQPIETEFDLNEDGKFDTLDVRVMRTLCTRTRCSTRN